MSGIYNKTRDLTAPKAATKPPQAQDVIHTAGIEVQHGPAPKAEPVPALFSRTRPGVDPLSGGVWR